MALDDFIEPEVGLAVAVTAVALSPKARETVRKGLVYGLAGILRAGDTISGAAQTMAASAQQVGGTIQSNNGPVRSDVVPEPPPKPAKRAARSKEETSS